MSNEEKSYTAVMKRVDCDRCDKSWLVATDDVAAWTRDHAIAHSVPRSDVHKPFTDDGVTYCGWDGNDGCGESWPCSTVRARGDSDGPH